MKKNFLATLLAFLAAAAAVRSPAATVYVDGRDLVGNPVPGRSATITLTKPSGTAIAGPWLALGDSVQTNFDAGGRAWFSNMWMVGNYRLDVGGNPGRSVPFSLASTDGVWNVISLLGTNANPQIFPTVDQMQAMIAAAQLGGQTNALTNVFNFWIPVYSVNTNILIFSGASFPFLTITNDHNGTLIDGPAFPSPSTPNGYYTWDAASRSYRGTNGCGIYRDDAYTGITWLTNAQFPLAIDIANNSGSGISAEGGSLDLFAGQWYNVNAPNPGQSTAYQTNTTYVPALSGSNLGAGGAGLRYFGSGIGVTNTTGTDVRNWGAKGDGATDDSAALQAAIDSGNPLLLPSGMTFVTSNLFLKSGTVMQGGGTLKMKSGNPGLLLNWSTGATGISVHDLQLLGNSSSGEGAMSIRTDSAGSSVYNVWANQFGSNVFVFTADASSSTAMHVMHTMVSSLTAMNSGNGAGFYVVSHNNNDSEYFNMDNCTSIQCATGLVSHAANTGVNHCMFLTGGVGIDMEPDDWNLGHGIIANTIINHNSSWAIIVNGNWTGHLLSNLQICSPGILLVGCGGINFENCQMASCNGTQFIVRSINGVAYNTLRNCRYEQSFGGRAGVGDGLVLDNQDGTLICSGSYSRTFVGDTDGSAQLPALNPPLAKAYQTNQAWYYKSNNTQWVIGTALNTTNWSGGFTNKQFGP